VNSEELLARRAFLKRLSALFGVGVPALFFNESVRAQKVEGEQKSAAKTWHYKVGDWTGDNFERGHKLRDAELPAFPVESEGTVEFAIVGGGIAGLSAAHYLRDHDFLLLEQYADLGGQSRGGSFQGIDYTWGPAAIDVPSGLMEELLEDLNLSPVILTGNRNRFYFEHQWIQGADGGDSDLARELKRFIEQSTPIWKALKDTPPAIPLLDAQLTKLDSITFMQCLSSFSPKFIGVIDSMCRSFNCLGVESISALAGYAVSANVVMPNAVFRGGNTAIAKALVASIRNREHRCQTGSFVWSIDVSDTNASIVYSDKNNLLHRVNCRHVIITSPPLVSARTLKNLDNATKAKMLAFKYGSFLVANCLLKKPVFPGSFSNWCASPQTFTNVVIAETAYKQIGQYSRSMGSVLTVYQPYVPGSAGRTLLIEGDKDQFGRDLTKELAQLADGLPEALEEIVFSRWGHAMVATNAGCFKRLTNLAAAQGPAFSLAHCSSQGMPTAVRAARLAADNAIGKKQSLSPFQLNRSVYKRSVGFGTLASARISAALHAAPRRVALS
jgi:protoporphyrinogen oxidase